MAKLKIHSDRIISNIGKLSKYLASQNKEWTLVTKVLGGHKKTLEKILNSEEVLSTHSIGDSRLTSLKVIKKIKPDISTMYLKPPAKNYARSVVKYSDISLNTQYSTLKALSDQAVSQKKNHRVIIMIEMGELREGVLRENIIDFYKKAFDLPNIEIIGLGTNLGCMYGIEPTFDKLIQLSIYEQLIEAKFDKNLEIISGGSSITLPLLAKNKVPEAVNHLRVGEAIFLGTSPFNNKKFKNLSDTAFEFDANIVELEKKDKSPDGVIGEGNVGHVTSAAAEEKTEEEYRAVLDFGLIDADADQIKPKDKSVSYIGTTSDMTVYSLGKRSGKYEKQRYIQFQPNYMTVARLMNSKFIDKEVV